MSKQIFYQKVTDTFTLKWMDSEWLKFRDARLAFSPDSLDKKIIGLEVRLHPLIKQIAKYQDITSDKLDLTKIPNDCIADLELQYLGRDILFLEKEISERGKRFINDLKLVNSYSNHRYTLLVATAFKKQGYTVEFIPENTKEKRPDLYVKNKNDDFYVECKQRNQPAADLWRFELLADISEKIFQTFKVFKYSGMAVNIKILDEIKFDKKIFLKSIISKIGSNNFSSYKSDSCEVIFFKINSQQHIKKLLHDAGHLKGKISFTVVEDYFFSSSAEDNAVFLNKKNAYDLPRNLYSLLEDANKKESNNKELLVYIDMGKGVDDWTSTFAHELKDNLQNSQNNYPNIDGFIVMQSPLKVKQSGRIIVQPNPFTIAKRTIFHFDLNSLPGSQGSTGLDNYLNLN